MEQASRSLRRERKDERGRRVIMFPGDPPLLRAHNPFRLGFQLLHNEEDLGAYSQRSGNGQPLPLAP